MEVISLVSHSLHKSVFQIKQINLNASTSQTNKQANKQKSRPGRTKLKHPQEHPRIVCGGWARLHHQPSFTKASKVEWTILDRALTPLT